MSSPRHKVAQLIMDFVEDLVAHEGHCFRMLGRYMIVVIDCCLHLSHGPHWKATLKFSSNQEAVV
jgi:hypothetical protein